MALPTYASTGLPYAPMVDSWTMPTPFLPPVKTDMEGGNVRLRTRPGDDVANITFAILYTKAQFATFRTFVETTLGRGTSRFTMQVWLGDGFYTRTVWLTDGTYKPSAMEPKVKVDFDLQVLST